jgi:hypothetical protein
MQHLASAEDESVVVTLPLHVAGVGGVLDIYLSLNQSLP